jgi:hypothetical protein
MSAGRLRKLPQIFAIGPRIAAFQTAQRAYHLRGEVMIESMNYGDEQPLQEFVDLHKFVAELPHYLRQKLLPACERVGQFIHLQSKLIKIAQDAVDDLQLELNYLRFDLEATRREKAMLQELQDDQDEM